MLVNILHSFDRAIFSQYFGFFEKYEGLIVKENASDDELWDLVIVFENVSTPIKLECRAGGLVFISGEPEEIASYTRDFIRQFDIVYSTHKVAKYAKSLVSKQYFNDWHFGLNYESSSFKYSFTELLNLEPPNKSRDISVICSSLEQLPRHIKRVEFLNKIKNHFGERIDFFGRGFNFIPDKADALLDYKFHICIENSLNKDLWTEKLSDPIIAYSIPIYSGCPNINDYIPESSFIKLDIEDVDASIQMIESLLSNVDAMYRDRFESIVKARVNILNHHNMFAEILNLIERISSSKNEFIYYEIKPNEFFRTYRVKNFSLRLEMLIRRQLFKIWKRVSRK